ADEANERAERAEVRRHVLPVLDDDAESLLQGDRELDEIERVETERALDTSRERSLGGQRGQARRVEPEPLDDDVPQLSDDCSLVHPSSRVVPIGPRGALRTRFATSRSGARASARSRARSGPARAAAPSPGLRPAGAPGLGPPG